MKILIYSDLHQELNKKGFTLPEDINGDIMILAGDVLSFDDPAQFDALVDFLKPWGDKPVLYIPGNHEYYTRTGLTMESLINSFYQFTWDKNIHLLDRAAWIDEERKVAFYGMTMWTDLKEGTKAWDLTRLPRDYRHINVGDGVLRPQHTMQFHKEYLHGLQQWLNRLNEIEASSDSKYKRVVISHHAPLFERGEDRCDAAFVSTKTKAIIEDPNSNIDVWIYGHTHKQVDYMAWDTRVISNAYGYEKVPHEQEHFDPYGVGVEL